MHFIVVILCYLLLCQCMVVEFVLLVHMSLYRLSNIYWATYNTYSSCACWDSFVWALFCNTHFIIDKLNLDLQIKWVYIFKTNLINCCFCLGFYFLDLIISHAWKCTIFHKLRLQYYFDVYETWKLFVFVVFTKSFCFSFETVSNVHL